MSEERDGLHERATGADEVFDDEYFASSEGPVTAAPARRPRTTLTTVLQGVAVLLVLLIAAAGYLAYRVTTDARTPTTVTENTITQLKTLIAQTPSDPTSYFALADVYYGIEAYGKAADVLVDLQSRSQDEVVLAECIRGLAAIDAARGDEKAALEGYLGSLEITETPDARFALGMLYLERGEFDGSIEQLERYVELRPNDADGLKALARALEADGDTRRALSLWQQVQSYLPGDPEAPQAIDRLEGQQ